MGRRFERLAEPRTVNRYIAVSDAVYDDWRGYLESMGVAPPRVQVIQSGVPVETFAAPDPRAVERRRTELRLGDGPTLISVARFHRGKNLHVLPAVVDRLSVRYPDIVLLLVGGGEEEQALREQVARLGLGDRVRFLGVRSDLPELFALADVFLFPSGQEGFGLVAIEALAAGLPLVTTRLPSLRHLWSRDIGIELADSVTPEAFETATERVLSRPGRGRAKARFGQDVVRREWSAATSAAKYLEIYREVAVEEPGFRS